MTLSNDDLFEVATLVYRRWSEEYDALKKVRRETNDGSPDWEQFHIARLESAAAATNKWRGILDRITPLVKMEV